MAHEVKYLSPDQEKEYVAAVNAGLAAPDFGGKGIALDNTGGTFRHRFVSADEATAAAEVATADHKALLERFALTEKLQRAANAPPDQIAATQQAKAQADAAAGAKGN